VLFLQNKRKLAANRESKIHNRELKSRPLSTTPFKNKTSLFVELADAKGYDNPGRVSF